MSFIGQHPRVLSINSTNVRGSEGGGTVTLSSADKQTQWFDLTADETVLLPSAGVIAGDIWCVENKNQMFFLNVQASDASDIINLQQGYASFRALVTSPVASTDWMLVDFYSHSTSITTFTMNGSGGGTSSAIAIRCVRVNNLVTLLVESNQSVATGVGSNSMATGGAFPPIYRPTSGNMQSLVAIFDNGVDQPSPGRMRVGTGGIIEIIHDTSPSGTWTNASTGGLATTSAFWPIAYSVE